MSLDSIIGQLTGHENKVPPVELWDPPYCGEMDIVIKADGSWYYNGSIFKRMSLVKLFASVIKKENDEYFLVTPVEKIKITVEDAPFVLTQWQWQDDCQETIIVATNLDDEFALNPDHRMRLDNNGQLYVTVRRNLEAKVHRNVYYQWVDIVKEVPSETGTALIFQSAGQFYTLGEI
ncbi:DUF1285 domain-containing protein [Thalassotalea atypica]|uniref:DUF1285 domain-containing protein n=1 Tax=Thalassotalea atypica TaxID=2054316 RepID=UPI0025726D67|nr:DUF1285 domain-containing protein [Thalassotalea atypica]